MSGAAIFALTALLGALGMGTPPMVDPRPRSPEYPDPEATAPGACRRCGGSGRTTRTRAGLEIAEHACPNCRRRSRR